MPKIIINEIDNTTFGSNQIVSDNIVFIPGTAITGPSEPTLVLSSAEFKNLFGATPPEGKSNIGTAWEYANNLLLLGFPVLFKRVTESFDGTPLVQKAKADINITSDTDTLRKIGEVEAKYGGTYGNTLNFSIDITDNTYYFKVYSNNTMLEIIRIASVPTGAAPEQRSQLLLNGMKNLKPRNVVVTITDETDFDLQEISRQYLTGGQDADESTVRDTIQYLFEELKDKLMYNIKFVTSGGYTDTSSSTILIAQAMINLAETRGDCIAIPDIPINLPEDEVTTFFENLNTSYAAAYAPWALVRLMDPKIEKWMPPSYVFLSTLARSVANGNPIYLPPAGVKRAQLTNVVTTEYPISSAILEEWQSNNPQSINPLMKIYNYGYVIYGQHTLYAIVDGSADSASALQELSVRLVTNEIKRLIYNTSMYLTFDQNNVHTWNSFKARIEPELDKIKMNNGITDYKVVIDETTITEEDMNQRRIRGVVMISITHAAENFVIDFQLEPSSVTFDERVVS